MPVAPRPIAAALLDVPDPPKCDLPDAIDYSPDEIKAYAKCWRAAYDALFVRHRGLIRTVIHRQRTAAQAVKAAKS